MATGGHNKLTQEEWIRRAVETHGGKYDYSTVNYTRQQDYVSVLCPEHGIFQIRPYNHVRKMTKAEWTSAGCPKCGVEAVRKRNKAGALTQEQALAKLRETHGDLYEYGVWNGYTRKMSIICSDHGEFFQLGNNHMRGTGCPKCKNSKGEKQIALILESLNAPFEKQKKFSDCLGDNKPLAFDFWIPTWNTLIEYDGEQHFRPVKFHQQMTEQTMNDMFERVKRYDAVKNQYCQKNNIRLLRIPYYGIAKARHLITAHHPS